MRRTEGRPPRCPWGPPGSGALLSEANASSIALRGPSGTPISRSSSAVKHGSWLYSSRSDRKRSAYCERPRSSSARSTRFAWRGRAAAGLSPGSSLGSWIQVPQAVPKLCTSSTCVCISPTTGHWWSANASSNCAATGVATVERYTWCPISSRKGESPTASAAQNSAWPNPSWLGCTMSRTRSPIASSSRATSRDATGSVLKFWCESGSWKRRWKTGTSSAWHTMMTSSMPAPTSSSTCSRMAGLACPAPSSTGNISVLTALEQG
mmetsp:Transcript_35005/g.90911  ORF Transcript_35005/g.90911 Transcript_35005/m.90911 type:complete len:265 (-) Transcript_35005:82-876(-)